MRVLADFITALIFRSSAFFISDAVLRSKNRRLQNFILIGTLRVLLTLAFLISLSVVQKGQFFRPFG
jgi:hypothetical protein